MTRLHNLMRRRLKPALITAAAVALLILNVAAVVNRTPERYEYKSLWFRIHSSDNIHELQNRFTVALNREAAQGWEFMGRCAHTTAAHTWVDYCVFRRRIR